MRVDKQTFGKYRNSSLVVAIALLLAGSFVSIFACFWIVIGIVSLFVDTPYPMLNAALFILLGGLVPGLGAVLLFTKAAARFKQRATLTRFVSLVTDRPHVDFGILVESLGLRPGETEAVLIDAIRLKILPSEELSNISRPALPSQAINPLSHPYALPPGTFTPSSRPSPSSFPAPPPLEASNINPQFAHYSIPSSHAQPQAIPFLPSPQALVGRLINSTYQIEALIGSGGMGAVFRCRHMRTGRRYAFKILLPDSNLSMDALRRFEREATAASALGHPGIIAVHDFNRTEEGISFLVMDLLEGENLMHRLERHGSLPWNAAQRIALEIGDALACAHAAGLMHRDVKPANIFLAKSSGGSERSVLVDFGLVKQLHETRVSRVTAGGIAIGTPLYMSPEQAKGEPLDYRSDIYSLAAVLHETLTGTPPFFEKSLPAVYARLLNDPAPRISSIIPTATISGLDEVLARALEKRPENRHESMRAFLGDLARIRPTQKSTVVI